jgi:chorismate dehydratase
VACCGPVMSVKLHFRAPAREVRRVALDEGSRTSAALAQILLAEQYGVRPQFERLPIGCGAEASDADAVLLIGDRAIATEGRGTRSEERGASGAMFVEVWDLGEVWNRWTGLPFVFAMWVARPAVDHAQAAAILATARDRGVKRLDEIAAAEAGSLGIDRELAVRYLNENLHFALKAEERKGLRRFYDLCVTHGLAPAGFESAMESDGDKIRPCGRR